MSEIEANSMFVYSRAFRGSTQGLRMRRFLRIFIVRNSIWALLYLGVRGAGHALCPAVHFNSTALSSRVVNFDVLGRG
jgi:hypothetical protein